MSGTSSTQPGPTEAAPLTPEQRKAYAEIGAALAAADACFVNPAPDATRSGDWQQSFDVQFPATQPALSSPQPAADERVAEHMRLVADLVASTSSYGVTQTEIAATAAVESSARALLAAGRVDTEILDAIEAHTNWELAYTREPEDDEPREVYARTGPVNDQEWNLIAKGKTVREAIRAAMQKGTP